MTRGSNIRSHLFLVGCFCLLLSNNGVVINVDAASSDKICPAKCETFGCSIGYLHCKQGGLDQIPTMIPQGTTKIVFNGHNFQKKILSPANFSNFATPNNEITDLTISSCMIQEIVPGTFANYDRLKMLVLSDNRIARLEPRTFYGLKLNLLILNDNPGIQLHRDCFQGLSVVSLSLKNCQLTTLAHDVVMPIIGPLKALMLNNNKLTGFSPKFDTTFRDLDRLGLENNPFHCGCTILWLNKVIVWRDTRMAKSRDIMSSEPLPRCASPPNLEGQLIDKIPESKLQCSPPRLKAIELNMLTGSSAELLCQPENALGSRVVYLKFDSVTGNWRVALESPTVIDPILTASSFGKLQIERSPVLPTELFSCRVEDNEGKRGPVTNVSINWIPETLLLDSNKNSLTQPKTYKPPINVDIKDDTKGADRATNNQPTDKSTSSGGDKSNNKKYRDHFLFQKKFTLLEMIGAVVGTFTITLAIFLGIYRCFFYRRKKERKKPAYSTYDPSSMMFAPDTQTYDIPQLPNYPPPPPPSRDQFLDYKTQRALYNRV